MYMYIRMYDDLKGEEIDNLILGIVLCADKDEDIAKYSVVNNNERLFASKYKLFFHNEEELKAEIETQKDLFYLHRKKRKSITQDYMNLKLELSIKEPFSLEFIGLDVCKAVNGEAVEDVIIYYSQ